MRTALLGDDKLGCFESMHFIKNTFGKQMKQPVNKDV
jgi:hypothetical protein